MKVLQLIDSLEAGGAERMAVNLANALLGEVEGSYLCTTRKEGMLKAALQPEVGYLFLNKKRALDLTALLKLRRFIKAHQIDIIHAHSSSYFIATLVKLLYPKLKLVWHDHYGNSEFLEQRPTLVLGWCSIFFNHVFSVNHTLQVWAKQTLKVKSVCFLPNFASLDHAPLTTVLKGTQGKRLVCLANLRPQKDHFTLIDAFKEVVNSNPEWSLHLIGKDFEDDYSKHLKHKIHEAH